MDLDDLAYDPIIVETKGRVGVNRLNRPDALNALNAQLIADMTKALDVFEADDGIGCIVITGSDKAFAAGADIKEMQSKTHMSAYKEDFISKWDRVATVRKPVVAAVAGFALGGGCELAMMCDIVIAADTARFGQPEIKLGVMPGSGGTQRLFPSGLVARASVPWAGAARPLPDGGIRRLPPHRDPRWYARHGARGTPPEPSGCTRPPPVRAAPPLRRPPSGTSCEYAARPAGR
jgi:hypothetical protein